MSWPLSSMNNNQLIVNRSKKKGGNVPQTNALLLVSRQTSASLHWHLPQPVRGRVAALVSGEGPLATPGVGTARLNRSIRVGRAPPTPKIDHEKRRLAAGVMAGFVVTLPPGPTEFCLLIPMVARHGRIRDSHVNRLGLSRPVFA